ncbi:RNA recognition motif domain-containing protein [Verrucomicrobiota bacterium]
MLSSFLSPDGTTEIAVFSLAWLAVGILIGWSLRARGRRVRRPAESPKKQRSGGGVEVYVGNLSYEISEKDLIKTFEQYGTVASARLIENKSSGRSKGYGFVEMADQEQARTAIRSLNGKEIKGRAIVVNEAKSHARDRD